VQQNRDGEQNLFNPFGLFSLLFLLWASSLSAESFADFKRVQSAAYSEYKDERDNAFNAYLKAQWRAYKAYITPPMYKEPKPKSITPKQEQKAPNVGPIVKITLPQKEKIKKELPTPKKVLKKDINFDFFGTDIAFSLDKSIKRAKFYPQNQAGIANVFTVLASSDYETTLDEIKNYKERLKLNDWGLYLLVSRLSEEIYLDPSEIKIYTWFLLNKLGYSVKIALSESKNVYILHYSKETVYAAPRYSFKGKYYYIISKYNQKSIEHIYTYDQEYPKADKALDFSLKYLPSFEAKNTLKRVSFQDYGKVYEASYHYNQNIFDFLKTYPQVDYRVYFNAPMEHETYRDLAEDIKKYTDGKKISEAMNIVLRFVQKAFKYERDFEQFGHEKVMFAQETLIYSASDCEDRAVLFAYLVKKLFGVRVVGVKYSDHMSTALYIPLKGDSVIYNRRRYVLADPTYVNANIGQEMPKYRNIQPESFIRLSTYK
jgi:hypothetical protein